MAVVEVASVVSVPLLIFMIASMPDDEKPTPTALFVPDFPKAPNNAMVPLGAITE